MKKIFLDTNVILDLLLERDPWDHNAALLFSMADRKDVEIQCCSLSFSTAIYLMQKLKYSRKEIVYKLTIMKSLCIVTTIDGLIIDRVLQSDFDDLEDALQHYSALANGANVIITRNKKDFSEASIPVMTPTEFLDTVA